MKKKCEHKWQFYVIQDLNTQTQYYDMSGDARDWQMRTLRSPIVTLISTEKARCTKCLKTKSLPNQMIK